METRTDYSLWELFNKLKGDIIDENIDCLYFFSRNE